MDPDILVSPKTTEHPAPPFEARRITGWNRKDWLAYISTLYDQVASRGTERCNRGFSGKALLDRVDDKEL